MNGFAMEFTGIIRIVIQLMISLDITKSSNERQKTIVTGIQQNNMDRTWIPKMNGTFIVFLRPDAWPIFFTFLALLKTTNIILIQMQIIIIITAKLHVRNPRVYCHPKYLPIPKVMPEHVEGREYSIPWKYIIPNVGRLQTRQRIIQAKMITRKIFFLVQYFAVLSLAILDTYSIGIMKRENKDTSRDTIIRYERNLQPKLFFHLSVSKAYTPLNMVSCSARNPIYMDMRISATARFIIEILISGMFLYFEDDNRWDMTNRLDTKDSVETIQTNTLIVTVSRRLSQEMDLSPLVTQLPTLEAMQQYSLLSATISFMWGII